MSRIVVNSPVAWAEACSSAFVPLRVRTTGSQFRASLEQVHLVPGMTVTRVSSAASEVYRSDRLIAEHPRDDVIVSLHRTGAGAVRQHGRTASLRAGSAALYDASAPYTLSFGGRMTEHVLQVSRRSIPVVGQRFSDLTAQTLVPGPPLRALMSLAGSIDAERPLRRPVEDEAMAEAMVSLLRAALSAEPATSAPPVDSDILLVALRRYISDHLADPSLSPATVARAHHVSLRLVQKVFAREGETPAAFILAKRLALARLVLREGESVATTAHRCGFTNVDTFARAFKRELGFSPSQSRAG